MTLQQQNLNKTKISYTVSMISKRYTSTLHRKRRNVQSKYRHAIQLCYYVKISCFCCTKLRKKNVSFVIKRRYYELIYIHKYQFSWFVKTLYFRRVLFSWIFEIVEPPLLTSTHIQMYMGAKYSLNFFFLWLI